MYKTGTELELREMEEAFFFYFWRAVAPVLQKYEGHPSISLQTATLLTRACGSSGVRDWLAKYAIFIQWILNFPFIFSTNIFFILSYEFYDV